MNDGTATGVVSITPHATNNIATSRGGFPRAFYCQGAGDVSYECWDGSTGVKTCEAGEVVPIAVRKVFITGTTATGIVGMY